MTHKKLTIVGFKTCDEVNVFLDRNAEGEDFVRIIAWHNTEDGLFIQSAEADVFKSDNDTAMMLRYIADFSSDTAHEFVKTMKF